MTRPVVIWCRFNFRIARFLERWCNWHIRQATMTAKAAQHEATRQSWRQAHADRLRELRVGKGQGGTNLPP